MIALVHSIYEEGSDQPVLTHIFYGETPKEALEMAQTHARFDEFFRAAFLGQPTFQGMAIRSSYVWRTD